MFDVTSAKLRFPAIDVPLSIGNSAFSPDGRVLVVSGGADETVIAYDTTNGHELGRTTHPEAAVGDNTSDTAGLAFVGGRRLAIGSVAGPVRIVDVPSMSVIGEIDAPAGTTTHLIPLDDQGFLGNGSMGVIRADAASGTKLWFVDDPTASCPIDTVIDSAERFYCADGFGRLVERDLVDGRMTRRLDTQNGSVGSIESARGGTELVAFGDAETAVTRWRLDGTGPITRRLPPGLAPWAYSPDGTKLAAAVPLADHTVGPASAVAILDTATYTTLSDIGGLAYPSWIDNDSVGGVTTRRDGNLVVGSYDLSTSTLHSQGAVLPVAGLFGSAYGGSRAWVAYQKGREGHTTEIWTIGGATGKRIEPTIESDGSIIGMGASPDGKRLAVANGDVVIYDTTSGKEVKRIHGHALGGVHFTETGNLMVWTSGGELTVYDLATLAPVLTLPGSRGYLLDVQSDTKDSMIASLGGDRSVALTDVATGASIGSAIDIADGEVIAMALRPDGRELALGGSNDEGMQIWDLDPDHWVDAACHVAGRNLTRAEWDSNLRTLEHYRRTCSAFGP